MPGLTVNYTLLWGYAFIIIINGQTALFEPYPSLEDSARFNTVFTSLDFVTIFVLERMGVSLASNPQPGGLLGYALHYLNQDKRGLLNLYSSQ
jgi:hypothetical protein